MRKSWLVLHDMLLIGRCLRVYFRPVLEYCSAVRCLAADIHLLNWTVKSVVPFFLTSGVFQCDIAYRRSVAVLCMLFKIRCNPMHPLYRDLTGPYGTVRVILGSLIAHRNTYAPPSYRSSQYHLTFSHAVPHDFLTQYRMTFDFISIPVCL